MSHPQHQSLTHTSEEVSVRLRALRELSQVSVEDMAVSLGLTVPEYEEFESAKKHLTYAFLASCAKLLGVDVSEILSGESPHLTTYAVCRSGEGLPIRRRESFYHEHLAYQMKNRLADPCMVVIRYDAALENKPITLTTHAGQEYNYILSGALRIQIGEHQEMLHAGDSIYFDSSRPHGEIAIEGQDCTMLAVVMKTGLSESTPQAAEATASHAEPTSKDALLYKQYVNETVDDQGRLTDIAFDVPEFFNFGFDVVDKIAQKNPHKMAMVWESADHEVRHFTFGDMSRKSSQIANYLESLGVGKGDRVMLILKRHPEFWFTMVALHKLGAVAIPATNQLTEKDLTYRFDAAGVKAVICTADGEVSHAVEESVPHAPTVELMMLCGESREGWLDFQAESGACSDIFPRPQGDQGTRKDDLMLMYFTSGTTGYPKIAAHDYTYPIGHIVTARWWHNVDPDGLHLAISDSGWGKAAWGKLYGQWLCEAAIFTYDFERFNADDMLKMFAKHKITTFCAPPTMYRMFIKEDLSNYDLSSLQYSCTAGEALNPEVFNQWKKHTGLDIMEGFGQTETTLVLANLIGAVPRPGSMGKPNPQYNVRLVDGDGEDVKAGEVGEIVLDTSAGHPCGMFSEYYRHPELTKEAWHDGLYHTGDTAWCDEEGFFWYVGRTDDIIKSSGYRIGPFEIESVIMELPYILECAITGAPDEVRGQVIKASIVLTNGTEANDELKKAIQTHVKERTAPYKYPRIVEFLPELPKTISGKIRRVELRAK